MRPGRFDRRLYFDVPTQSEREDLVDYFLERKKHHSHWMTPRSGPGSRTSASPTRR